MKLSILKFTLFNFQCVSRHKSCVNSFSDEFPTGRLNAREDKSLLLKHNLCKNFFVTKCWRCRFNFLCKYNHAHKPVFVSIILLGCGFWHLIRLGKGFFSGQAAWHLLILLIIVSTYCSIQSLEWSLGSNVVPYPWHVFIISRWSLLDWPSLAQQWRDQRLPRQGLVPHIVERPSPGLPDGRGCEYLPLNAVA